MIDKMYGKYYLSCDVCGEEAPPFDDFQEALDYIKASGWATRKYGEIWAHACPECPGLTDEGVL